MDAQRHRIKRVLFEFSVGQEAHARQLHAELGRIHERRVIPLLDQCLSRLVPEGELVRIDTVELDLGSLAADNLEAELSTQLQRQLGDALRRDASSAHAGRRGGGEAVGDISRLQAFVSFIETGCLPWWMDSAQEGLLDSLFDELIDKAPRSARRHLPDLMRRPRTAARLVRSIDPMRLSRLAALISGFDASEIGESVGELIRLLSGNLSEAGDGMVPPRGDKANVHIIWQAVLDAAARQPGQGTNRERFWRIVLLNLAASYRIQYATVLSRLHGALDQQDASRTASSFASLLQTLAGQMQGSAAGSDSPPMTDGSGPAVTGEASGRAGGAASRFGWPEVLRLLRQRRRSTGVGRPDRLIEIVGGLLDAGIPPGAEMLPWLPYLDDILRDRLEPPAREALRRMLEDTASTPADATDPDHEPRQADVDVEEAYVENAGLVILWPFLERFFRHLDLLNAERFRDASAACRAVGLLQYLATEDPTGPEFLLPLNKVLCGLEPVDLFEFDEPVSDNEMAESGRLLEAAVEHAPILRNMSAEGFRGSFLLRKGVLSASDGAWLLRVERESYDVVLDRFPWPFDWIRLPWMPAALRVEW